MNIHMYTWVKMLLEARGGYQCPGAGVRSGYGPPNKGDRKWTQIFCKSNICSWLLSLLSITNKYLINMETIPICRYAKLLACPSVILFNKMRSSLGTRSKHPYCFAYSSNFSSTVGAQNFHPRPLSTTFISFTITYVTAIPNSRRSSWPFQLPLGKFDFSYSIGRSTCLNKEKHNSPQKWLLWDLADGYKSWLGMNA